MADSVSYSKPTRFANHQKSFLRFFCKSVFFVFFLVAIPLFPSQAPTFVDQSLLTKFWELLHLLFIGVAVTYGLFSTRNLDGDFDTTHYSPTNLDDLQSSISYVSRLFHVPPIFDDGCENLSGSDDQNMCSQYYRGDSNITVTNGVSEHRRIGLLNNENVSEISLEHDENSGVRTWTYQYVHGESIPVLSQLNYEPDDLRKPRHVDGCKPLGLPVRSLRSRIRTPDSPHCSEGSESRSCSIGASNSSGRSLNENNFGEMDPINLEERFNENSALRSEVQFSSRFAGLELREKVGHVAAHPSHSRPLSVDERQFESLGSHSFRSTTSLSSLVNSMSNSPTMLSPAHSNTSSDSLSSITEELGKAKDFFASYPPTTQSSQASKVHNTRLNAFHLRRYSSGSLFAKDSDRQLKDEPKESISKRRDGLPSSKRSGQRVILESDKKLAAKGKSVRTIRSGVHSAGATRAGEKSKAHIDDRAGKAYNEPKASNIEKTEMKKEGLGDTGISSENLDAQCDMPKPAFAKYLEKGKEKPLETVTVQSGQDSESETDHKSRASLSEDAVLDHLNDAWSDSSEVDRKAGEFIAKFREQIRLQKVASVEKSKGLRLSGKHLR